MLSFDDTFTTLVPFQFAESAMPQDDDLNRYKKLEQTIADHTKKGTQITEDEVVTHLRSQTGRLPEIDLDIMAAEKTYFNTAQNPTFTKFGRQTSSQTHLPFIGVGGVKKQRISLANEMAGNIFTDLRSIESKLKIKLSQGTKPNPFLNPMTGTFVTQIASKRNTRQDVTIVGDPPRFLRKRKANSQLQRRQKNEV